jgi:hypothetical protein
MSTVQGGQGNIVTNGLVLNLDAANPRSYPQPYNGTTWQNIAPVSSSLTGSLVNGPTFSTSGSGCIAFDGVDDNVVLGNVLNMGLNNLTLSCWVKLNTGSGTMGVVGKTSLRSNVGRYVIYIAGNQITALFQPSSNFTITTSVTPYVDGKFHNMVLTIDRTGFMTLYIDSTSVGTPQNVSSTSGINLNTSTDYFRIGAYSDSTGQVATLFLNGNIASTQVYNRALNASEVLQNFNATRARFGV